MMHAGTAVMGERALARDQRRLAAIVSADVVGYSLLMGRDDSATLAGLKAHRQELFDPTIAEYGGRIVKTTGDGLLLEFPSVVDAVRCAVDVQRGMAERNAEVPPEQRIEFRVGINVGDIIIDGDDIFGDGVNVAARLEGLAYPNGICVSRKVRDEVRDKLDLAFEDMGEQEYFADGIVEEIITALSRVHWLFVIARNSSFTYKGRPVDIKQVGRELGVRYVLEGSVRRAANRLRITGQLIDASNGAHIWADRFDGGLEDVFDLQDRIAASVVGAR